MSSLLSGLSEAVARANVVNRLLHRRHMRSRVPLGEATASVIAKGNEWELQWIHTRVRIDIRGRVEGRNSSGVRLLDQQVLLAGMDWIAVKDL